MQTRHHHSPATPLPAPSSHSAPVPSPVHLEDLAPPPPQQLPWICLDRHAVKQTACETHHKPSHGRVSPLPHPGRRLSTKHTQNPNLARGRTSPCSRQPSFRSRSCHWPQAGILPHQIQSQVVQLLSQHPVTHPVLNSAQDHSPVPIPDPETPPPVSNKAPVHLTHSQQHITTASPPAKPNLIPCSSSPALSLFKPGSLSAPVPHPDQDQPSSRLKSHLPLHVLQTRSTTVPKKEEAQVLQLLQTRTSPHPWCWGHQP